MNMDLDILRTAHAMASHASKRQSVIATNIANADTPGYKARDLPSFSDSYAANAGDFTLRSTRPGHRAAMVRNFTAKPGLNAGSEQAPNGNTVSLELEMIKAAELRNQYDMALGIYRKSIDILRTSLGK